ncbi:hypothetical protein SBA4_6590006 [Candidatus Sulfopaludibacter sp. SbA4]|nr:hypothetical protein SBA4_6590006 [Candidatus Sulfopaludibacter sp. SbA4]
MRTGTLRSGATFGQKQRIPDSAVPGAS